MNVVRMGGAYEWASGLAEVVSDWPHEGVTQHRDSSATQCFAAVKRTDYAWNLQCTGEFDMKCPDSASLDRLR